MTNSYCRHASNIHLSLLPWLVNPSYGFIVSALRHASRRLLPLRLRGILFHPWKSCVASPPLFLHHLWCWPFSHFVIYLVSSLSQNTSLVDCYIISRSSPTHCALHYYGSSMTKAQRHVGVPRWLTECCWYHSSFMVQPYIMPIYQRFSSNHSSIKPHTMFSIITFSSSSSSSLVSSSNINNDYNTQIKSRIVSSCWQSLAWQVFLPSWGSTQKPFTSLFRSPPDSCMLSASPFTSPIIQP